DPRSLGLRSRYLHRGHVIPQKGVELVDRLSALGRSLGKAYLIAIAEHHLMLFARERERLAPVKLLCAPLEAFEAALDKNTTIRLARECGIDTPRTWTLTDLAALDALQRELTYPVVLKWSEANAAGRALGPHGLKLIKAEYAYDFGELKHALERYRPAGIFPLIQEYVPGVGVGQFFFMHEGRAIRAFQHRRVREWPPEGGTS